MQVEEFTPRVTDQLEEQVVEDSFLLAADGSQSIATSSIYEEERNKRWFSNMKHHWLYFKQIWVKEQKSFVYLGQLERRDARPSWYFFLVGAEIGLHIFSIAANQVK